METTKTNPQGGGGGDKLQIPSWIILVNEQKKLRLVECRYSPIL